MSRHWNLARPGTMSALNGISRSARVKRREEHFPPGTTPFILDNRHRSAGWNAYQREVPYSVRTDWAYQSEIIVECLNLTEKRQPTSYLYHCPTAKIIVSLYRACCRRSCQIECKVSDRNKTIAYMPNTMCHATEHNEGWAVV